MRDESALPNTGLTTNSRKIVPESVTSPHVIKPSPQSHIRLYIVILSQVIKPPISSLHSTLQYFDMTDEEFLTWLQSSIGYVFRKYNLLQTTLITPGFEGSKIGSEEEEKRYEGNRTSAQLGDSLIPLVVRYQVLIVDGASRGML